MRAMQHRKGLAGWRLLYQLGLLLLLKHCRKPIFALLLSLLLTAQIVRIHNYYTFDDSYASIGTQGAAGLENGNPEQVPEHLPVNADDMPLYYRFTKNRRLRFDWTALELLSPLALQMAAHQQNCSLPQADFKFRNRYGLGSDLHVWTQALCNGMDLGLRVRTESPWIYVDQAACRIKEESYYDDATSSSAMMCYFPTSELACPGDRQAFIQNKLESSARNNQSRPKLYKRQGVVSRACDLTMSRQNYTFSNVRAAGIEYLFTRLSPLVVEEAERQVDQVFFSSSSTIRTSGNAAILQTVIPPNLITVHIRWGDKVKEMKLVPIEEYVEAVESILAQRKQKEYDEEAHVFLATEDPRAVQEFITAAQAKKNWTVYVDAYFSEFQHLRNPDYNGNPKMNVALHGRPGLVALASLLIALQANEFVLTLQSNWSRIINELRLNVVDPRCGNCTTMIDLRPSGDEW